MLLCIYKYDDAQEIGRFRNVLPIEMIIFPDFAYACAFFVVYEL